ncbi:MAG: RING finger protein [Parachlamydiales bacterium]|nr:RING finger protein [Parachlamydiales bacterium]
MNAFAQISNIQNPTCPICHDGFNDGQEQWTHEGGENHDPFHKQCLKSWVDINPSCPLDRMKINRISFLPRTARVLGLAQKALRNTVLTATLGAGMIGFGTLGVGVGVSLLEKFGPVVAIGGGAATEAFIALGAFVVMRDLRRFLSQLDAKDKVSIAIGSSLALIGMLAESINDQFSLFRAPEKVNSVIGKWVYGGAIISGITTIASRIKETFR